MESHPQTPPGKASDAARLHLQEKLQDLPALPGVYLMKSDRGVILYIGKARSLKDRVRSYFQKGETLSPRIFSMVRQVEDLEWIITGSELEALILENTLVKRHKPRYNVILRDDKNYPFLRLPIKEPFPRISVVRRIHQDGALYFGPYVPVHAMRETLKIIKWVFPLATCKLDLTKRYDRACVEYEIKRCVAPCIAAVDAAGYAVVVREVRLFLEGKDRELLSALKSRMQEAADQMAYEEAARYRDRIRHIEKVLERQRMVSAEPMDMDVLALSREGESANLQVLFFRGGMLIGRKAIAYDRLKDTPDEEVYRSFIEQYYSRDVLIPEEILLPIEIPDQTLLQRWLSEKRGTRMSLTVPLRGKKKDLLVLASENARESLKGQMSRKLEVQEALRGLQRLFSLDRLPDRIEAFDISNIQGVHAVGSMVVWEGTGLNKEAYRHFRIRTVTGADDFAMMQEVLYRRFTGDAAAMGPFPDIIVIDGGKGQLGAVRDVLQDLGVTGPHLTGLAKDNGVEGDRLFFPDAPEPVPLDPSMPAARVLLQLRDEAHRFAIQHHRKIRGKETLISELDGVTGIGKVRKLALLRYFGSVDAVMQATVEAIEQVPKMNRKAAMEVWSALQSNARLPSNAR